MRRILIRSAVQRALLSVLVLLLAFGPVTVAFAAAGDEATEPATTDIVETEDPAAVEDSTTDDAVTTTAATEDAGTDDPAVEATAAEDEEVEATQAPSNGGPYTPDPEAPGAPSGNGNGGGPPHEQGSKGNADDKNPPGQLPGPDDDGDSGYECDGNNGASQGNPAHTQCPTPAAPEPDVQITKNPDPQTVVTGGTATWTIVVTNTGNQALTGVEVDDPRAPNCDKVIGNLAVGASHTYTCTLTNVTANFTNVATVTTDQNVSDDDSAAVIVNDAPVPGLAIQKSPDNQTVQSGGTATWTITVTNTGNTDLTGVVVTDPLAPDCAETIGDLDIGDSDSFTCSLANVTASFTNVATADSNETGPVSDDARVTVPPTAPVADVSIEKAPDDQLLVAGETAEWDITVTNTGQAPLTGVAVTDQRAPDCNATIGNLAVGASRTYDCELANVRQSFTNVAVVSTNETPDKSDDADVRVVPATEQPSILLHKRAAVADGAVAGDLVHYEFDIINNGSVTLTNVTLNDPRVGGNVVILDRTLTPGEVTHHSGSVTYTLTQADIDAGQVPNTAVATGTPPSGPNVSSTATALVLLDQGPGIELTKSGPERAEVGDTITYEFIVRNTGSVTLTNVMVEDDRLGISGLAVTPSTLTPGAVGTASATYTVKPSDAGKIILNTAIARGTTPGGDPVEDSDDHEVDVPLDTTADEPEIRLDKSGPARAGVGDDVTYTFEVTNTGNVTLTNVRISDPLLDLRQLRVTPSTLAAGESGTATATYTVTEQDGEAGKILNTAVATGTPPQGPPVRDDDDHTVIVPSIPPPPPPRTPELPATGAASTGYALTALLSLMMGALFLRLAGSPAASTPSHFAQVLRGPDANSLHMMLRRIGLAPKPGGRQLR